jgi:ABC-type sugar transport system ATPase subunit
LTRAGAFCDISFQVRAGEIVGVAGLVGAGRSEVARAIFGAERAEGTVDVNGVRLTRRRPASSIRHGLALLPESRQDDGLVMMRPVYENVSLAHLNDVVNAGFVRGRHEKRAVRQILSAIDVRAASISMPVAALSGGNQQKVALAKWLVRRPCVLLADEPTRGVDVGAKRAIYGVMSKLAAAGVGIVLISSEVEELLELANRILVMRAGRLVAEFTREQASEEAVMRAALGATPMPVSRTGQDER